MKLINTGLIGVFKVRAHHCTSVYGVSRLKVIFVVFPTADWFFLLSMRILDCSL